MPPRLFSLPGRRWLIAAGLALASATGLRAAPALHAEVLVFIPGYEGSQLFTTEGPGAPACVWGNLDVFLSARRYFALRLPNPLAARPLLGVGPIDVARKFVATVTGCGDGVPGFAPYTEGADFFVFAYDWRQEIATGSAPALGAALDRYAEIHARATGIPARETRFLLVAHSMGGLVARTLLREEPARAARVERLYLVGTPNGGTVEAIKTLAVGPDSLRQSAHGFPGILLQLVPTDVDQEVTKLTTITRPTIYELLPTGDPQWQRREADGTLRPVGADAAMQAEAWARYWPTASLERRRFLDGWLKENAGGSPRDPAAWEYCQDPAHAKLDALLAQARAWRRALGPLGATDRLLTRPGESSRLRLVIGTGIATPTGVVTSGAHDGTRAEYLYATDDGGDGTVEARRVLDGLDAAPAQVLRLRGVPHVRLMIDRRFLDYFTHELAHRPMAGLPSKNP